MEIVETHILGGNLINSIRNAFQKFLDWLRDVMVIIPRRSAIYKHRNRRGIHRSKNLRWI